MEGLNINPMERMSMAGAVGTSVISQPLVFINIGWMKEYKGPDNDPTIGGHGYLKDHDFGHEAWNFAPTRGRYYGYIPRSARINLKRLGASAKDVSLQGVTVVWVARNPRDKKTKVIGWYRNATIHKDYDQIEIKRSRNTAISYQIEAPSEQGVLLLPDQRLEPVPTAKAKGSLGQSPVWYGNEEFNKRIRKYIQSHIDGNAVRKIEDRSPRQNDPRARKLIEVAAIDHATEYYESERGGNRKVKSVEGDRIGWDLTVTAGNEILKVEVKGLSGADVCVELTPNEYKTMLSKEHRDQYVIYIVTQAGSSAAKSHVFYYNAEMSTAKEHIWLSANGQLLEIQEITGARLSVS